MTKYYKAENVIGMNEALAFKQGVTEEGFVFLTSLYVKKLDIEQKIEDTNNTIKIKKLVKKLRNLEQLIQLAWKFDYNPRFYYFDLMLKKCSCPKLDNCERIGYTTDRIYADDCIIHGIKKQG